MTGSLRPPKGRQPLLVPASLRDEARRLGAFWHDDIRIWSIASDAAPNMPRRMLPTRDRPDLDPPYIRINLIPQTSWGRNLRTLMGKEAWRRFVREHVYASTGSVCRICGGRGPEWPVEADEAWRFDDASGIQTLHRIVPLCPACHEVRSAGLATANGRAEDASRHLSWIERIPLPAARRRLSEALETWRRRSQRRWTIDLSIMESRYGIAVEHRDELTQDANAALVGEASRRHRRARGIDARTAARIMSGMPR